MLEQKAMERISAAVYKKLQASGFTMTQKGNAKEGMPSLFVGEQFVYAIDFESERKRFVFKTTSVTDGIVGTDWKDISAWLFDPATADEAEAESIANEFVDSLGTSIKYVERERFIAQKKKEKGEEHYVDPGFLMNRFALVFPELRYAIAAHRETYGGIAPQAMLRDFLYEMMDDIFARPECEDKVKKFFEIINTNYENGDLDTKAVIMMGILNHIESPRALELADKYLDESTKKAWACAKKYKGKKVRPEKVLKQKRLDPRKATDTLKI